MSPGIFDLEVMCKGTATGWHQAKKHILVRLVHFLSMQLKGRKQNKNNPQKACFSN